MKSLILISFILIAAFSFAQFGSTMFGLARNSPSGVFLATMDPATGIATNLSPTSISSSINLTGAALNPYTNQFCFIGDNGLKSIDLFTGLESNTATYYRVLILPSNKIYASLPRYCLRSNI